MNSPVKRAPTPGPITTLALEPTVQVKLNPDGTPFELPPSRRATPAPAPTLEALSATSDSEATSEALSEPPPREPPPELPPLREVLPETLSEPPLREALPETLSEPPPREAPRAVVRATKTPVPRRVTPAAAFDAVEADFFAREADLYKREAVDTFDDLDPGGNHDPRPSSSSNRRKRR